MTNLLSHKVAPRSYAAALRAAPFTADEIDRHPDADRIWATILEMRREFDLPHDAASGDYSGIDTECF